MLECTPEAIHNISQPEFQDLLLERLRGQSDLIEIRRQVEYVSSLQQGHLVHVRVRDRQTGDLITIKARFLIACDGAGSTVREATGITMSGDPNSK